MAPKATSKALAQTLAQRKEDLIADASDAGKSGKVLGAQSFERIDKHTGRVSFNYGGKGGSNGERTRGTLVKSVTLDYSHCSEQDLQFMALTNGIIVKLQAKGDAIADGATIDIKEFMPNENERRKGGAGGGAVARDPIAEAEADIAAFEADGVPLNAQQKRKWMDRAREEKAKLDAARAKRQAAKAAAMPSADVVTLKASAAKSPPPLPKRK